MSPEITNQQIIEALETQGTKAAAARSLGIPISTYKDRLKNANGQESGHRDRIPEEKSVKVQATGQTIESVAEGAGIDLNEYEVSECYAGEQGVKTVRFRRKAPTGISDALKGLLEDLSSQTPSPSKHNRPKKDLLVEMGLVDVHLGKLCWGKETGTDYDLAIAERTFANAAHDLVEKLRELPIGKFLFPVGSDFFQADTWTGQTTRGTAVDTTDDRFSKTFQAGCRAVWNAIDYCREFADVEVKWIPGNHDQSTSFYLTQVLAARYRDDPHVVVDDSPPPRKFFQWGRCLIGLTHGDKEKHRDLPLVMSDHPSWSQCDVREIHVGHLHTIRQTNYTVGQEFNGVVVRILPSLSGTDKWHFENAYTGNRRAAEAYVFSATDGYWGHVSANARD